MIFPKLSQLARLMAVTAALCTATGCGLNPRPEDPSVDSETAIDYGDNTGLPTGNGGAASEANAGGSGGAREPIALADGGTGSGLHWGASDSGADASAGQDGGKEAGDAQTLPDGSFDAVVD
ncbi:MAG: hypothetical protein HRU17_21465 [Polyangiaceae bacterium]|nr:hypothetical protein [Polyangiaceae bacterium]